MTQAIDSNTIAQYLLDHPEFFEEHAYILSDLRLTSPVIGKAVSLHERQIEVLRNKHKTLELQLSRLVHTAQDNKRLMEKMVDWMDVLLEKHDETNMPQVVINGLKTVFGVPEATLRLWDTRREFADSWFAQTVDDNFRNATNTMEHPYCGKIRDDQEAVKWFDNFADLRSVAIVPLRKNAKSLPLGLLVMGSPDATRFRNEMATDFLSDIGKLACAALAHLTVND